MQKKEFIATWKRLRTVQVKEAFSKEEYFLSLSMVRSCLGDLDKDAENLWRRYRHVYKDEPVETLEAEFSDDGKKDVGKAAL
jgi:hypothetical protein